MVLRTKQEYLYKYKLSAFLIMAIYLGGVTFTKKSSKNKDNSLKNDLEKFRNHNEEDERKNLYILYG
jgi:hypothetical protein